MLLDPIKVRAPWLPTSSVATRSVHPYVSGLGVRARNPMVALFDQGLFQSLHAHIMTLQPAGAFQSGADKVCTVVGFAARSRKVVHHSFQRVRVAASGVWSKMAEGSAEVPCLIQHGRGGSVTRMQPSAASLRPPEIGNLPPVQPARRRFKESSPRHIRLRGMRALVLSSSGTIWEPSKRTSFTSAPLAL